MISGSLTTELQSRTDIGQLSEYHMLAARKERRTKKENVWRVGWGRRGSAFGNRQAALCTWFVRPERRHGAAAGSRSRRERAHDVLVCVGRVLERSGARRAHHGFVLVHILPRAHVHPATSPSMVTSGYNATDQAPGLSVPFHPPLSPSLTAPPNRFQMPELMDVATPACAKTRTGFDCQENDLVLSDKFDIENRTFFPGTTPTGRPSTSGTARPTTWSGTTPSRSRRSGAS